METIGQIIRASRKNQGLLLRQFAAKLDIDTAILSKIERGERKPTREQILRIAEICHLDKDDILIQYLSEKIAHDIAYEELAPKVLIAAEKKINYLKALKHGKI